MERGTNVVVGMDPDRALAEARQVLAGKKKVAQPIELWDGKTAPRILDVLIEHREVLEQGRIASYNPDPTKIIKPYAILS